MGATKKGYGAGAQVSNLSGVSPNASLIKYVADLNAEYGRHARVVGDVRSIIDGAMGEQTLTDLLYKSRNEDTRR